MYIYICTYVYIYIYIHTHKSKVSPRGARWCRPGRSRPRGTSLSAPASANILLLLSLLSLVTCCYYLSVISLHIQHITMSRILYNMFGHARCAGFKPGFEARCCWRFVCLTFDRLQLLDPIPPLHLDKYLILFRKLCRAAWPGWGNAGQAAAGTPPAADMANLTIFLYDFVLSV